MNCGAAYKFLNKKKNRSSENHFAKLRLKV